MCNGRTLPVCRIVVPVDSSREAAIDGKSLKRGQDHIRRVCPSGRIAIDLIVAEDKLNHRV